MPEDMRARQCGHKVMHPDMEQARAVARKMHKRVKARFMSYHCPWCGAFHVGVDRSPEAARRRSERRAVA